MSKRAATVPRLTAAWDFLRERLTLDDHVHVTDVTGTEHCGLLEALGEDGVVVSATDGTGDVTCVLRDAIACLTHVGKHAPVDMTDEEEGLHLVPQVEDLVHQALRAHTAGIARALPHTFVVPPPPLATQD